jgi:hypothetical protein
MELKFEFDLVLCVLLECKREYEGLNLLQSINALWKLENYDDLYGLMGEQKNLEMWL